MISPSDARRDSQIRTYDRAESAVFLRTTEEFGGLSNMAGGFPLVVNGLDIFTSEALYQACRFPHMPEVQRLIIAQASPMTAKMKSKPYRLRSRPDWNQVRVKVMRWCLRVKLAQNWARFSELLLATGNRPIVEASSRDDFWGAKPVADRTLVGMNVLGRLLMELREEVRSGAWSAPMHVAPLSIPDFLLDGRLIQPVIGSGDGEYSKSSQGPERRVTAPGPAGKAVQIAMFDQPLPSLRPELQRSEGEGLTDSLKPYPTYKDSGVPWLGQVPVAWAVGSLRHRYASSLGKMLDSKRILGSHLVPYLRNVDVQWDRINTTDLPLIDIAPREYERYTLKPGDLLVCEGGEVGRCAVWRGDIEICGFQKALHRLRPLSPNDLPRYLYYTFRIASLSGAFSDGHESTIAHLTGEKLRAHRFAFPPTLEQSAIVRFLDHADRRIQRYIRTKKKLIALLNEQKQAIIHRTVTRGLDPNVRLKPSGVEWLGDVPEHWEVWKIGHLARVGNGSTPSRSNPGYWNGGSYPWLNSASVNRARISHADQFVTELALRECHLPRVQPGSVLLAITGQGRTRGTAAMLNIEATINQHLAYVTPRSNLVSSEYLLLTFIGAYRELRSMSDDSGSTKGALTCGDIAHFKVAIPPVDEQTRIIAAAHLETQNADVVLARTEREIDLLREYRTRLIADVVTGKLDVREAAARLPEVDEEAEPLDGGEALMEEDEDGGAGDLDAEPEEAVA